MPDLYGNDAAQSDAPLPSELTIAEVRLRNMPAAPPDTSPGRRSVLILPLGLIVLVVVIASVAARLFAN